MTVQGTRGPSNTSAVVYQFRRARAEKEERADAPTSADSAGITEDARQLNEARAIVEGAPAFRENRVRALKAAIANGTYEADPRQIARTLLDRGL